MGDDSGQADPWISASSWLDRFAAAEGTMYRAINSDLGLADDKPTQAVFEFLGGVLKK